jgi:hypothetical protein
VSMLAAQGGSDAEIVALWVACASTTSLAYRAHPSCLGQVLVLVYSLCASAQRWTSGYCLSARQLRGLCSCACAQLPQAAPCTTR